MAVDMLNVALSNLSPIDTENKGRQMLEKMGWKEGQGLGRDGGGLREPV